MDKNILILNYVYPKIKHPFREFITVVMIDFIVNDCF